jgi:translation elongation factor EF-Ts
MSAGRIESYIHSDNITPNKGGVMVRVTCQTDFAARTDEFVAFAKHVAVLAYAYGAGAQDSTETYTWDELRGVADPAGDPLELERQGLEAKLKEKVTVEEIVVITL